MKAIAWLVVPCLVAGAVSCISLGKSCTEIGCVDGASLSVRSNDGTWADGAYVLTFGADGATRVCAFKVPEDLPPLGSQPQLSCDPELGYPGASLVQDAECFEHRNGDSVSQSCTPLAGQYHLQVGTTGTPTELDVALTRDGSTLLDETVSLTYTETQPNGEGCEPVCRQASAELTFD